MYSYFIFAIILILVYVFFHKPSSEIDIDNKSEKEEKAMINAMKDQDEFLCHFCGSTKFENKDSFHGHIKQCSSNLRNT